MDRARIATELAKDLDSALVKPPPQGKYGEYVSAFDIITTANKIFEWDGWSYTVEQLKLTNAAPGAKEGTHAIGYLAVVTVTVGDTRRGDVGHGQGHGRSLGDAHDSAMKEAVTDALKRALRTFGNPLGLALYDKTKAHVSDNPDYDPVAEAERADKDAAREIAKIHTITSMDELGSYWKVLVEVQKHIAKRLDVIAAKDERKAVIGGKESK